MSAADHGPFELSTLHHRVAVINRVLDFKRTSGANPAAVAGTLQGGDLPAHGDDVAGMT
jgi:hypothetical protein